MPNDQEFNYQRPLGTGIIAAIAFAILVAVIYVFLAIVGRYAIGMIGSSNTAYFLFFGILALGILSATGLYAFVNSKYGSAEALISSVIFIGFSLVLVPVVFFLFAMFVSVFLGSSLAVIY